LEFFSEAELLIVIGSQEDVQTAAKIILALPGEEKSHDLEPLEKMKKQ
jgi:hypothetical protein